MIAGTQNTMKSRFQCHVLWLCLTMLMIVVCGVRDNSTSFLVPPESLPLPWGCASIAKNVYAIRTNLTCQAYHSDTYLNHSNILRRSITPLDDYPLLPTPHGEINTQRMKHMFYKLLHAPPNTSFNILVFGGSLTTGHRLGRQLAWPGVMEGILRKFVKQKNTDATTATTATTTATATGISMKVNVFNRAEGGSSGHWALNRLGLLFADLTSTDDENIAAATSTATTTQNNSNSSLTTFSTINTTTQAAVSSGSSGSSGSGSGGGNSPSSSTRSNIGNVGRFDGAGSVDGQTPVDLVIVEYDINDCAMFGGENKDER